MAVWQVDFDLVPQQALRSAPQPITPAVLDATAWWAGASPPPDYRTQLDAVGSRGASHDADVETWGEEQGNRVEVRSNDGKVRRVIVRVDVRRLDARFGAALLTIVKRWGATLVRRDGVIVEPTIAAFAAALRGSSAWRHANDTAAWLAARARDDDDGAE
jgi:hypothetical protein